MRQLLGFPLVGHLCDADISMIQLWTFINNINYYKRAAFYTGQMVALKKPGNDAAIALPIQQYLLFSSFR